MRRHKVFQYVQTLTEVGLDRQLDRTTCCIRHQTTHTCKLFDLLVRTTGSGICHHEDVIVFIQPGKQSFCQFVIGCFPCLNNFFVTFFFCDQTTFVVLCDLVYSILCSLDHLRFLRRYCHIRNRYGHRCSCRELVTNRFYIIQNFCCLSCSVCIDYFFQDLFELFLSYVEIYFQKQFVSIYFTVYESKILRNNLIEQHSSKCSIDRACLHRSVRHLSGNTDFDSGMQCHISIFICQKCFV